MKYHILMKNVLVTGAAGFVGTCVITELLEEKYNLKRIYANVHKTPLAIKFNDSRIIQVNQKLDENWNFDFDVDYIFNFAADGTSNPYSKEANAKFLSITQNAKNFAVKSDAGIFHSSSGGAALGELNKDHRLFDFALARRNSEEILLKAKNIDNLQVQIGRLYTFIGPTILNKRHYMVSEFLEKAYSGEKIIVKGNLNSQRTLLYESEMARWIVKLAFESKLDIWNISGYESVSTLQIAQYISDRFGVDWDYTQSEVQAENYLPQDMTKERQISLIQEISWQQGIELTAKYLETKKGF